MIVNPDIFKTTVITKSKQDNSGIPTGMKDHCIAKQDAVKLLGITISFSIKCVKRLRQYIAYEKTHKTLVQSFVLSHFNYCPLVWYFTTAKQLQKIEKIQERVLRFIADDYETSYEVLMTNTETTAMRAKQMQTLCVEIYKTLSNLNPE